MSKILLLQGNQAVVEGAIAAGVKFFGGYPITPSTEVAESLAERLPLVGGKFIQMEDEIASMGAIIGAALTGKKVMTATSGPGFSLKQELIGYACMAEIPLVIVNVQRGGPSTGLPTKHEQSDLFLSIHGSHGDAGRIVLSVENVRDCIDLTVKAFNLAEKYQVPVLLLSDGSLAFSTQSVPLPRPRCLRHRESKALGRRRRIQALRLHRRRPDPAHQEPPDLWHPRHQSGTEPV